MTIHIYIYRKRLIKKWGIAPPQTFPVGYFLDAGHLKYPTSY